MIRVREALDILAGANNVGDSVVRKEQNGVKG
jgi:hypothetical protein